MAGVAENARLILASFGPAATAALRQLVDDTKGTDPLAPVDVVVPSAVSSVTVRRQLAEPALINVRFSSLDQLAHRLAARHMALSSVRPLTLAARALAVRAAIRTCTGRLAEAADHPSTAALIEDVCAELDDVETFRGDRLDHLAATSPRGRELAAIYGAYRREVAGRPTPPELLDTARDAVGGGEAIEADESPESSGPETGLTNADLDGDHRSRLGFASCDAQWDKGRTSVTICAVDIHLWLRTVELR